MGLFDKITQNKSDGGSGPLMASEAFAAIALAAVASDGYLSEEEAQSIPFTLSRMKLFKGYSDDQMRRLFDRLLERLQRDGVGALFSSAQDCLEPSLRETAFTVATDLVLADGVVTDEESQFLQDLETALGIDSALAQSVIQVMQIKNRG